MNAQGHSDIALRARDSRPGSNARGKLPGGLSWAWATPAATPSGSNARVLGQMLQAVTPSGSNARCETVRWYMSPKGSQLVERKRPHALTTPKGSQPVFRVRDSSGKPAGLIARRNDEATGRGLAADSPTRLLLSRGTPKQTTSNQAGHQISFHRPQHPDFQNKTTFVTLSYTFVLQNRPK